ncbi:hypothetical protein STCU_11753 [Strigomonas culicis]|uniref:Uncharacterized protein n=1 Tax=Strigomonas culicis TaxID=28005 RepID=S9UZ26_9TRYP|nr:hypothetical protein STCU_11753 [Strigomonas culicis]|eukprot:EPY15800.1 hypothetical protein STCU_11753 [Strigomonas culicis]
MVATAPPCPSNTLAFIDFYSEDAQVRQVPLALLADECKRSITAAQSLVISPSTADRPRSCNERRISSMLTKEVAVSMFSLGGIEVDGCTLLPLIRVPLDKEHLSIAISFMYLKYRLDMDSEKQSSFSLNDFAETKDPFFLLAISVALGM